MRRIVIAPIIAVALLCLVGLLLIGAPQSALAAPVPASALAPSSNVYTAYVPLVMADFNPGTAPEVYPNDPYLDRTWGLEIVGAPKAWGITCGSSSVVIAVLDSGVDLDHPDLSSKLETEMDWDFVNGDDVADDDHGHGTHVSGIAAAATDNGVGVPSLGWDVSILPVKVLNADGVGNASALADAIRYAADHGADVVNMSLGGAAPCPYYLQEAVDYAYGRGVLLVAAAGNNQGNTENFPANCEHVLGVSATDSSDSVASYSNYGDHVDVAAPGTLIYSTVMGGEYGYKSGTSMATPHVAGLAALIASRYPSYTPDQLASALLDNAVDLGSPGWDMYAGCGRIDAYQSLLQGTHGSSPRCLAGTAGWTTDSAEAPPAAPFAPGEVIVSFRPGGMAAQTVLQYGRDAQFLPALRAWRLQVSPGEERTALAQLRADPTVAYADLNYLVFGD